MQSYIEFLVHQNRLNKFFDTRLTFSCPEIMVNRKFFANFAQLFNYIDRNEEIRYIACRETDAD